MIDPFIMLNDHILVLGVHMFLSEIDVLKFLVREIKGYSTRNACITFVLHDFLLLNSHEVRGDVKHELSCLILDTVLFKHHEQVKKVVTYKASTVR
jgi:hypothetical protein